MTGYRVRLFRGESAAAIRTWNVAASARSLTASNLTLDRGYSFDVTAVNAVGRGRPSP
jgi:hypothetical protein